MSGAAGNGGSGPQADPEQKPKVGGDQSQSQSDQLNIKVKDQKGEEVFFRIKRNTQLRKLMTTYCERQSLDPQSIVFLFDGHRIKAEETPEKIGMEDGDEVDAMLHQIGGSFEDE